MKQHRFCALQCITFTAAGDVSKEEENCMSTCFNKYSTAFESFKKEQNIFHNNLADLEARGVDIYSARHI